MLNLVKKTKLLGTIITDDLKWDKNTIEIVKKSYQRMQLLTTTANFISNIPDLKSIYLTYISVLEQSEVVWHSSLTAKNRRSLERVQKSAVRVMLKNKYTTYKDGLKKLNIPTLDERRELLCLRFAKKCLKTKKVQNMFPKKISRHKMKKRRMKTFKENRVKTKRYAKSTIPYLQKLLNKEYENKKKILKN